jgi:hypothetical protein
VRKPSIGVFRQDHFTIALPEFYVMTLDELSTGSFEERVSPALRPREAPESLDRLPKWAWLTLIH